MGEEGADFHPLPDSNPEEKERITDVKMILKCLKSLTDHIACLEHENVLDHRTHKTDVKHFDLGLIRYQLWLSAASQKVMEVTRELECKHNEWYCPEELTKQLSNESKCILDESFNDGLAIPLEPERVWMDPEVRLPSSVLTQIEYDNVVVPTHSMDQTKSTNYDNKVDNDEFRKKVDQLRNKLKIKDEEFHTSSQTTFDSRSHTVLENLKSLEDNMAELKQLLRLLERDIEVPPKQHVTIKAWYEKEIKRMRKLTEDLKYVIFSKRGQLHNLKRAAYCKIKDMQLWHERYLKEQCVSKEQQIKALKTILKIKEEAYHMCGHVKKQCDEYVATLDASKQTLEDGVGKQKTLNKRIHAVTQKCKREDAVGGMEHFTTLLQQALFQTDDSPSWTCGERKRILDRRQNPSPPKSLKRWKNPYIN